MKVADYILVIKGTRRDFIPAKAGIHFGMQRALVVDSHFRGNEKWMKIWLIFNRS